MKTLSLGDPRSKLRPLKSQVRSSRKTANAQQLPAARRWIQSSRGGQQVRGSSKAVGGATMNVELNELRIVDRRLARMRGLPNERSAVRVEQRT